jgi:hypothetical protein
MRGVGIAIVWLFAAIASVSVLSVVEPDAWLSALALALAGAVVVSLLVQLVLIQTAVLSKDGFVGRLMMSNVGAFGIVLVASVVALVMR